MNAGCFLYILLSATKVQIETSTLSPCKYSRPVLAVSLSSDAIRLNDRRTNFKTCELL